MTRQTIVRVLCLAGVFGLLTAVAEAAGPYQFFSVPPCRIVDTRNPVVPNGTGGPALAHGVIRNFPITGFCNIPSTAKAAVLNVTIVGPSNFGFLTVWPFNTAVPPVSTINFDAGESALANGAIVPLTTDPNFNVSAFCSIGGGSGSLNLILDVTGYFQ
jgi:hypothetical protein